MPLNCCCDPENPCRFLAPADTEDFEPVAGDWTTAPLATSDANAVVKCTVPHPDGVPQVLLSARINITARPTKVRFLLDYIDADNFAFLEVYYPDPAVGVENGVTHATIGQRVAGVETSEETQVADQPDSFEGTDNGPMEGTCFRGFLKWQYGKFPSVPWLLFEYTPVSGGGYFGFGTGDVVTGTVTFGEISARRATPECLGGRHTCPVDYRLNPDCATVDGPVSDVTVTISGSTGTSASLNGTYTLPFWGAGLAVRVGACTWSAAVEGLPCDLTHLTYIAGARPSFIASAGVPWNYPGLAAGDYLEWGPTAPFGAPQPSCFPSGEPLVYFGGEACPTEDIEDTEVVVDTAPPEDTVDFCTCEGTGQPDLLATITASSCPALVGEEVVLEYGVPVAGEYFGTAVMACGDTLEVRYICEDDVEKLEYSIIPVGEAAVSSALEELEIGDLTCDPYFVEHEFATVLESLADTACCSTEGSALDVTMEIEIAP